MAKLIKTTNPVDVLVDTYDFNKWYGGWLNLFESMVDAQIQWYTLWDSKPELAEKAKQKYYKMKKLENEWPGWEEKYDFEALRG